MENYKKSIIYYTDEAKMEEKEITIYSSPKEVECIECVKSDDSHIWISLQDAFDIRIVCNDDDYRHVLSTKQKLVTMIQLGLKSFQNQEDVFLAIECIEEQDRIDEEMGLYERGTEDNNEAGFITNVSTDIVGLITLKDIIEDYKKLEPSEKRKFDVKLFLKLYGQLNGKQGNDKFGRTVKTPRELFSEIDKKMGQHEGSLNKTITSDYWIGYENGYDNKEPITEASEDYKKGYAEGHAEFIEQDKKNREWADKYYR